MNSLQHNDGADPKWAAIIDDRLIPMPRRKISTSILRYQGNVGSDRVLFRDHNDPNDPIFGDEEEVDLAEGNVFYSKSNSCESPKEKCLSPAKRAFVVDDAWEEVIRDDQTGKSLLELFNLDLATTLLRDFESPNDVKIGESDSVQFADGCVFRTQGIGHGKISITIVNEDDGAEYILHEAPSKKIGQIIDEFYSDKLNRPPRADDRLRCEEGGGDILTHREMTLREFEKAGHCRCEVWLFAGGTGGA